MLVRIRLFHIFCTVVNKENEISSNNQPVQSSSAIVYRRFSQKMTGLSGYFERNCEDLFIFHRSLYMNLFHILSIHHTFNISMSRLELAVDLPIIDGFIAQWFSFAEVMDSLGIEIF